MADSVALPDEKLRIALSMCQDIAAENTSTLTRMPEDIFRQAYLPLFVGEKNLIPGVSFEMWANKAGGFNKPMHVVDRATDRVLFTVPPLLDTSMISTIVGGDFLYSIIDKAEGYNAMHPDMGRNIVAQALSARVDKIKDFRPAAKHLETWNAIMTRYGLPPFTANAAPGASAANPEDLLEFD